MNTPVILRKLWLRAVRSARSVRLRGAVAVVRAALGRLFRTQGEGPPEEPADAGPATSVAPRQPGDREVAVDLGGSEPWLAEPTPETESHSAQFLDGCHTEGEHSRAFKLYVPPHRAGKAFPLVVMLHGCTQTPDDFAIGTGMNDLALAHGFFVLYPAQSDEAHGHRCWNWYQHRHQQRGGGEPALLAGMTRAVMAEYGIDPQRVYVAGLSAGGAMAAILGDAYPELFAAVGVHSGLATGAAKDVTSAWVAMKGRAGIWALPGWVFPGWVRTPGRPTIVFHGDRDKTVHPINGARVVAASLRSGAMTQTHLHRGRTGQGCEYTRTTHQDLSGQVTSEHWLVHGAGHAWSGGRPQGSYTDPQGPDATSEMLRFFWAHPLPALQ